MGNFSVIILLEEHSMW